MHMSGIGRFLSLAFLLACAAAAPAHAAVIFSNIDQPYSAFTATTLMGMEFVPVQSGKLQSIDLPLAINPLTGPKPAQFYLYSGPLTGLLESWDMAVSSFIPFPGTLALTTLTSHTSTDLVAGNSYWIVMLNTYSAADPGVMWGWDTSPAGPLYTSFGTGGGGFELPGAPRNFQLGVRVNAEIPEPVTLSLFGAGLFGAGLMRRRGKTRGR